MKALFALFLAAALLLFGCAQQAAAQQQQGTGEESELPPPPPSGENIAPAQQANNSSVGPQAPLEGEVKEFTVEASQWQFSPDTITVNKGDVVKITLVSKDVSHGFALPDFGFDIKAGAGESVTGQFTADKAGTFQFRCSVFCGSGHSEMTGTLIVNE